MGVYQILFIFGVGRLRRFGQLGIKLAEHCECAVKVSTQILADCSIQLFRAGLRADVVSREEAFEHQVNDVRRGKSRVHSPQGLNALKQPGIETIRHLPFFCTFPLHTVAIHRQTL